MRQTDVGAEIAAMRDSIDTLARGLNLLADTLETHTEMLGKLMEAATAEPAASPVTEMLKMLLATLDDQTASMQSLGTRLESIGDDIETAVVRGFHRATSDGEA